MKSKQFGARAPSRSNRLARTIVLGAVAVLFAIVWLANELGMDRDELLDYLGTSLLFVGMLIVCALVGAVLVRAVKKLLR